MTVNYEKLSRMTLHLSFGLQASKFEYNAIITVPD